MKKLFLCALVASVLFPNLAFAGYDCNTLKVLENGSIRPLGRFSFGSLYSIGGSGRTSAYEISPPKEELERGEPVLDKSLLNDVVVEGCSGLRCATVVTYGPAENPTEIVAYCEWD
jgi:hypothetical protein